MTLTNYSRHGAIAMTTTKRKLLTADDLLRLYSQGVRGELIGGVLCETQDSKNSSLDTPSTPHATLHLRTNEYAGRITHHLWLLSVLSSL